MTAAGNRRLLAIGAAGIALCLTSEALALDAIGWVGAIADAIAGLSFIGVGLQAWYRRPENRVGPLMVASGFAWFVDDLNHLETVPLVYTAGLLLAVLVAGFVVHLLMAFPDGFLAGRAERAIVAATYVEVTLVWLVRIAFFEPRDHGCAGCEPGVNLLAIHPDRDLYAIASTFFGAFAAALGVAIFWQLARRWRRATGPGRRALTPVLWAGCGAGLAFGLSEIAVGTAVARHTAAADAFFLGRAVVVALVPLGFLIGLLRTRMEHTAVSELVVQLAELPESGPLTTLLSRALNDPSLSIGFWLPQSAQYVDEMGRPVDVGDPDGPGATAVGSRGEPLAVLLHDPAVSSELVQSVAAAARLALENERLKAEVRAQLEEVQESRRRIVTAGDDERRRIERDLHDGAQQRLVSVTLALNLLGSRVEEGERQELSALLQQAKAETESAMSELRELARGIHPAVLTEGGIRPALSSLAMRAPVRVVLGSIVGDRLPPDLEAAVYFVCCEAVANVAKHAPEATATIEVENVDGLVRVSVRDGGEGGADPRGGSGLRGLSDRVAALGGELSLCSERGRGTEVTAVIPWETRRS